MGKCSCNDWSLVVLIVCIVILHRLGGCDNKDKDCVEQRLERIEKLLIKDKGDEPIQDNFLFGGH